MLVLMKNSRLTLFDMGGGGGGMMVVFKKCF